MSFQENNFLTEARSNKYLISHWMVGWLLSMY